MKELSSRARAHLDALRKVDVPDAGSKDRVWDAMMVRAGLGELGPEIPPDPPLPTSGLSTWTIVVGAVIGVAAIAGAVALGSDADVDAAVPGLSRLGDQIAAVPVAVPEVAAPDPVAPEAVASEIVAPPAEIEPVLEIDDDDPAAKRPNRRPRVAEAPVAADTFAEEVALLASARAALGSGDAKQAITTLSSHAKRFPRGKLAREREVSWITALCALGRDDEAKRRAADFLRRDSDSPHAAKVRASCGGPR